MVKKYSSFTWFGPPFRLLEPRRRYTVAVDFDGVLHSYTTPWKNAWTIPDPPVDGAIEWLWRTIQKFDVIIFTTRGKSLLGRWAVRRWIRRHAGAPRWYEMMGTVGLEDVRVTATKGAALIYLDDRAVRFTGSNFPTPEQVHAARPWNKERPPFGEREEKADG